MYKRQAINNAIFGAYAKKLFKNALASNELFNDCIDSILNLSLIHIYSPSATWKIVSINGKA